jgi:hypothetical protein
VLLSDLLVIVAEHMARKGKEIDRFGRLVWNKKGTPKIDRMLYSGCEIVEDTQCCQHITITTWH